MPSLAIRLAAPLQSWGAAEGGKFRQTSDAPTKSGVLGLISNAAGFDRRDGASMWDGLRMGVRVDATGSILRDFHTSAPRLGDGRRGTSSLSERTYLAEAAFLVVLEGDTETVTKAYTALRSPKRTVFLGRKSCVPTIPLVDKESVLDTDMDAVLRTYPWVPFTAAVTDSAVRKMTRTYKDATLTLPTITDARKGERVDAVVTDVPVSLAVDARTFAPRGVVFSTVNIPNPFYEEENADTAAPDPMTGLT